MIKIYPEIIFKAKQNHFHTGAFRLWFLAKNFNDSGSGGINASEFFKHILELSITKQSFYRWRDQGFGYSLLVSKRDVYLISSWQLGASVAGVQKLKKASLIPIEKFIQPGWLAWCWAAYIKQFEGQHIARETLEVITGVPIRTQAEYESIAGVTNIPCFATYGKINKDNALDVIKLFDTPGHYFKEGELRRRLPNIRIIPHVIPAHKGRLAQINNALWNNEEISCIDRKRYRLYMENCKQAKRAQRARKKSDGDYEQRPAYTYRFFRKFHRKRLYQAEK